MGHTDIKNKNKHLIFQNNGFLYKHPDAGLPITRKIGLQIKCFIEERGKFKVIFNAKKYALHDIFYSSTFPF